MDISSLLRDASLRCDPPNYSKLAERLRVEPSAVSNWRNGRALPDVVSCEKIAKITGFSALAVIAAINKQQKKSNTAKAVWRRIAAAAVVVLASGFTTLPSHAADDLNATATMHYAKWRELARFLSRQLRRLILYGHKILKNHHGSPALLAA
jgi:transcriptional regulator with XRE-family HTH domain